MNQKYKKINQKLISEFGHIVGVENCFSDYSIRWTYAFGGTTFEKKWIPELILIPQNVNQISKIMELANKNKVPVTPRGNGTSLSAGTLTPYGGIVLDLSQMNKILSISIENNIVEVEPGVICDDLNKELNEYNYFFPPDPGSSSVATIGGMVATNAGGVQAFKYGVTKKYVLILELVLADGKIIKLGSETLKSVSSYNLIDLIIGSEGTLGIVTKIGLRIIPLPQKRKLGLFMFNNLEDLTNSVLEIRKQGIIPNLLEFMDKTVVKAVFEYLNGEFMAFPREYLLLAEVDGNNNNDIEEQFSQLLDIIIKKNPIKYKIATEKEERELLISARKAALPALSRLKPSCCIEDCSIKITDFIKAIVLIEKIPEKINSNNLIVATFGHMEGNIHPTFMFNENDPHDLEDFEKAIDCLYKEIILPIGGTLTGEHGIGKIKTLYLKIEHGSEVINIMNNIKKIFDPNSILNPGMGKGIKGNLEKTKTIRKLKNQSDKILELNCMRCGFCIASCPAKIYYKNEAYSPRGRLSILNGLVYGDLELNKNNLINDIIHACTLCGLCLIKCPAGVKTYEIFENAREILHKKS